MTDSLFYLKCQLRGSLVAFYVYGLFSNLLDVFLACVGLAFVVVFHVVFLLVDAFGEMCHFLAWRTGFELAQALIRYHNFCMDEISERADSICESAAKIDADANSAERVAKALLNGSGSVPLSASNCDTVIQKIQLTRESRKELGAEISSLFLFILRTAVFMA